MRIESSFLLAVTVATFSGCATQPAPAPATPPPHPVVAEAPPVAARPISLPVAYTEKGVAIKVEGLWRDGAGGVLGVSGTAKNVTASDLKVCRVTLDVMDLNGVKVADAKAATNNLKSGQAWHFKAALSAPSQATLGSIAPGKVVAIPIHKPKAELASLQ